MVTDKLLEGRRYVAFCIDPDDFEDLNKSYDEYQGWSNSATWAWHLLFNQERKWYMLMVDLLQNLGRDYDAARQLFAKAEFDEDPKTRVQVHDDDEGVVNVREIVDFMANELDIPK